MKKQAHYLSKRFDLYIIYYFIFAMFIVLILNGCATMGFNSTPADALTEPDNYKETIKSYLERNLKDPDSLKDLTIGMPVKTSCSIGIYGEYWGWRVLVSYNAKNAFGGYVGTKQYYYWFRGETLEGITQSPTHCPLASGW